VPLADALRSGRAVLAGSREETVRRYPAMAAAATGGEATAAIPLVGVDGVIGVLGLGFGEVREWSIEDSGFALALGRICGQALDRARAHEHELLVRAELEAVLDGADDGVLVLDAAGRVLRLNRRALELLGQPSPPPRTAAEVRAAIARVGGRGATRRRLTAEDALEGRRVEEELSWGEAPRRLHALSTPVRGADGKVVAAVSVWRDITELHDAIAERAALDGARLTARRVTHEIGNALQSLLVHAELTRSSPSGAGREHCAAVLRDAERIQALLGRLHRIDRAARTNLAGQEVLDLDGTHG
jgi:PAS domain-containing protein